MRTIIVIACLVLLAACSGQLLAPGQAGYVEPHYYQGPTASPTP